MDKQKLIDALNEEKAGNWDAAHEIVQDMSHRLASLIHGYLHRVEGDLGNAGYWYNRASEPIPDNTLPEEWDRLMDIVAEL